jgi:hypothetical protein
VKPTYLHRYGAIVVLLAMVACVALLVGMVRENQKPKTSKQTKEKLTTLNEEVATIKAYLGIEDKQ